VGEQKRAEQSAEKKRKIIIMLFECLIALLYFIHFCALSSLARGEVGNGRSKNYVFNLVHKILFDGALHEMWLVSSRESEDYSCVINLGSAARLV
jgi:hypothetical protein